MDATPTIDAAIVEAAASLRDSCLADPRHPDPAALALILDAAHSPNRELAASAASALIRIVVEELSDRFSPELAECYVEIFTRAISSVFPSFSPRFLQERYRDLCQNPARALAAGPPESIVIPSRITLGADIAVTSVFLQALQHRFPSATLWFAGPAKNFDLFAGMHNLRHWPLSYPRGTLAERFAITRQFDGAFDAQGAWWLDPDSRISQLGLLPVAPLRSSLFFESRSVAPDSSESLGELAARWCLEHLGATEMLPGIFLTPTTAENESPGVCTGDISLSLGVGNNPTKRISAGFEARLLRLLVATGRRVWVDSGAGGEEAEAVSAAAALAGAATGRIHILRGSFTDFCRVIRRTSLYVGYDSAGQHAAAALGVPSITIFKGFASERMLHRWSPTGTSARVLPVSPDAEEDCVLDQLTLALEDIL